MGDEILKKIAVEITEQLRKSTTVDWQVRESVRARVYGAEPCRSTRSAGQAVEAVEPILPAEAVEY